jgi:hypothetical protein
VVGGHAGTGMLSVEYRVTDQLADVSFSML